MVTTAKPQWIVRMYEATTGRDHLGLGSVSSDQILPSLSPGINVLTSHPRYHSFYTFLLDEFWRRDLPRSDEAWTAFYRPRAFIFSLGANLCEQPEHGEVRGIVGGRKTGPLAGEKRDYYDTTTNYIKSPLGGYGLYYRSVIGELGLIYPGGVGYPYPVDVPSEDGKKLAAAFRQAVKSTEYYRRYFDLDKALVPYDVVLEYIHQACLCQLKAPSSPDNRLLLDIFLNGGSGSEPRRNTLRMFLDLAEQTDGYAVDSDVFRQLIYFQAADNGASYRPRAGIEDTYRRWRLYQAREYYAFALNALWVYLCEWGLDRKGDAHPIDLEDFWQEVSGALDYNQLAARLDLPYPGITADSDLRSLIAWVSDVAGLAQPSLAGGWDVSVRVQEHKLVQLVRDEKEWLYSEAYVAGMMIILLLVYLRLESDEIRDDPTWEISHMGSDGRLSVDAFISALQHRLSSGSYSLGDFTRWIYAEYVILQHQLVATSKLPDNTFRFQREGSRLRFYSHYNPLGFQDSRFDAISTTVYELGLCGDFSNPAHALTDTGATLLRKGDLP
ncbi:MAG: hypothetical protein JXC32_08435 [Anaerolineae bacterium]|nr:hypothetical protein [Anaerolineae bacterium]